MKTFIIASLAVMTVASARAGDSLKIGAEGSLDKMPSQGMFIYEPPATKGQAAIGIDTDNPQEGTGALKIECPEGAYASISFPLTAETGKSRIQFSIRGRIDTAREVTIGIQNFTMAGGFKSVGLKPVIAGSSVTPEWKTYAFDIERDPAATHWQFTVAVKGPGVVWLDSIRAE